MTTVVPGTQPIPTQYKVYPGGMTQVIPGTGGGVNISGPGGASLGDIFGGIGRRLARRSYARSAPSEVAFWSGREPYPAPGYHNDTVVLGPQGGNQRPPVARMAVKNYRYGAGMPQVGPSLGALPYNTAANALPEPMASIPPLQADIGTAVNDIGDYYTTPEKFPGNLAPVPYDNGGLVQGNPPMTMKPSMWMY